MKSGDTKILARSISLIENGANDFENLLANLPPSSVPVIGITGPPGAGKSTLTDALIESIVNENKKVGVLCIDPSSPFNMGALLGDRIRMNRWHDNKNVFIRSLASRGSLGGLHPKIIEITDILKASFFDYIIIETVGIGQSEIEIAGLADITLVVLVPEAGDEIQSMKSGLMEIADMFVVNKSDRPGADEFVKNLRLMLAPAFHKSDIPVPVLKVSALQKEGIDDLFLTIKSILLQQSLNDKHILLLTEKAYYLIQQKRMHDINKSKLREEIEKLSTTGNFNLYSFVNDFK
ncbi:MAG: methylmalonyl Co-A mutase-associated GTPase MeaB [Ferruginibacter sp.]